MKLKKTHFMGVGGAGCSAVFAIAKNSGFTVSGCDKEETSPYLDPKLKKLTSVGHSPSHIKDIDLLVYSPAITAADDSKNEEIVEAGKKGIKAIPWDEFVAEYLVQDKFVIAIAGTHGKGTATAMVGAILEKAGLDPTCLVGGVVANWGKNYRVGSSKYFVLEADEYSGKLLRFRPNIAAITNIEFDHPEYFRDFEELKKIFKKFVKEMPKDSILVVGPGVELENPNGQTIKVSDSVDFELKMVGDFNKVNAAIAREVANQVGVASNRADEALQQFDGLGRRFEFKGEAKNILVFDDYAHHPTAISKTLQAAREKFPENNIWVVYQPHLYSRTKVLFDDFAGAFKNTPVERIILIDIFGAREKDTGEISSADFVKVVGSEKVKYIADMEEAANYLVKNVLATDIVITMGAGDIYKLPKRILEKLKGAG